MASTQVQLEVENWIRQEWLPQKYNQAFRQESLRLNAGGIFDFDAVSIDNSIVVNISTSSASTSGGKMGAGKIQKLRADMLFLCMVEADKRIIVLTKRDMYQLCQKEKVGGRVPLNIEFIHVELPSDLAARLREAKDTASKEVSPSKRR